VRLRRRLRDLSARLAVRTTALVGTTSCVLVFAALTVLSAPGVGPDWLNTWANWADQAFLPLVLMPVLLIGANLAADAVALLIRDTHDRVVAILDALHVHLTGESHPAAQKGTPDDDQG
jgi:hypothetical protein